jgi:Glycosyl hydrolases family 15
MELTRNLEWLMDHWDQPDEGIWETRGGRRDFTYSRLMSWVAVERAIRIARQRGLPADVPRWMAVRDRIYNQIMERGWHPARRAFVQHYDTDVLDASLLLMPLCKFIAPTDPRWISTLDAITAELVSDSLVYRYNVDASPDGLAGEEATFSPCSFWWVEALARAGRLDEARLAFEKMLPYANHVGLYSEEIGPTGEQLGNVSPSLHPPGADQRRLQPRPPTRVSGTELAVPACRAPGPPGSACTQSRTRGVRKLPSAPRQQQGAAPASLREQWPLSWLISSLLMTISRSRIRARMTDCSRKYRSGASPGATHRSPR